MPGMPVERAERAILTFSIAGEAMTIAAGEVAEIIRPSLMTRVPHAPASLIGVTNFRGSVLPVVSLAQALRRGATDVRSGRILVVDRGQTAVGLWVDEVTALGESSEGQPLDLDDLLSREFGSFSRQSTARLAPAPQSVEISPGARRASGAYICFSLAGQDYALSLRDVVEVTSFPADLAELPQTDAAMVGVTNIRNSLVPLVALRALLGLPAAGFDRTRARVVSIRIGGRVVGLIVDRIKAIRRLAEDALDRVPRVLTRGSAEARIEAICRHEAGLISILASDKLFDQETSAQILADIGSGMHDMAPVDVVAREQFVLFELGEEQYGIPIASVDEIVRRPDVLARVPRAPAFVEGVINLRGKMVPVIDQRQRFDTAGGKPRGNQKIIVVTVDGLQTGVVVDKVTEILSIPVTELKAAPRFDEATVPVFDRIAVIERDGRMILLVDPKALLDRAERDVLSALGVHAEDANSS